MHESQLHRPSRMDWWGAWGRERPFEAVDGVAIGDVFAAEISALTASNTAVIAKGQLHAIELPEPFP
jgi:hypothetical protein